MDSTLPEREAQADVIKLKFSSHCRMLEYFFLYIGKKQIEHSQVSDFYFLAVKVYDLQKNFFKAFAAIRKLLVKVLDHVVDLSWIYITEIVPSVNLLHLWASERLFTRRPGSSATPSRVTH